MYSLTSTQMEDSRRILCISPELSLCAALFSLVFCPVSFSYLGLPGLPTLSSQLTKAARLCLDSTPLHCGLETLFWQYARALSLFVSPLSVIIIMCYLMSSVWKLLFNRVCPFVVVLWARRVNYSILATSGSPLWLFVRLGCEISEVLFFWAMKKPRMWLCEWRLKWDGYQSSWSKGRIGTGRLDC